MWKGRKSESERENEKRKKEKENVYCKLYLYQQELLSL
jgi:hypothetical protein